MRYFDPHIHMLSRTTDDYENMAAAGIVALVEPAFWQGQPRTQPGTFIDYFDSLVGWERFRASQFGIRHYCTIGLNPKEANNTALAEEVMKLIPLYCEKDGVVGVGEIGYDDMTDGEERFFAEQLQIAKDLNLPVLVHTPHRDKKRGTERTIALIREMNMDEEMVLIDHLNEETLPLVLETGCWRGHSVYPHTKMSEDRMVALLQKYGLEKMVVNSAADWGRSDPLKVPKTGEAMRQAGFNEDQIEYVLYVNPINFYAQSGRISLEEVGPVKIDQTRLWENNSVLRGQLPVVQ
ncbi:MULTISPECIES: TatD family hydrolase [Methylocaldum]|jgi:predicted metal-dependent TIM-barrel fold hydrolase|uniref:TatD family hydrolase n=1 Tax=unclassified Methylocaldum TaxID=2622260 RepID=UPI000A3268CB|nr:TatD family hydrolase [Methylocaldum sp. RMAD-M]MBP1148696.1 putative metal-dependent TIM-barrel fold hydrolase [Methylocaldum sp. RMAD-M]MDV3243174.1 TatD family hydrolase [Methylocaldum sp.]MVF20022.1 hydrolase TatD [Methylocaldum sp. BRCS4]